MRVNKNTVMRTCLIFMSVVLIALMTACSNASPALTPSSIPVMITSPKSTVTLQVVPTEDESVRRAHDIILMILNGSDVHVVDIGEPMSMSTVWSVVVTGDEITGKATWYGVDNRSEYGVDDRLDTLKGRVEADKVIIELDCTGQGREGDCHQVFTGKLRGRAIVGIANGTGLSADTPWVLYPSITIPDTDIPTDTPSPADTPIVIHTPKPIPWNMSNLGPIAYLVDNSLYSISPDGSGNQFLVQISGWQGISWSSDGASLAFNVNLGSINDSDIYIFSMKDKKSFNLTNSPNFNESSPRWSPDGSKIVFVGGKGGNDIYIMNSDGSKFKRLTECSGSYGCHSPDWSPSGNLIAYVDHGEIYTMSVNGSEQTKLVNGYSPRWSPSGNQLAFYRANYLYVINTDGTGLRALTGNSVHLTGYSWSPDGKFITFGNSNSWRKPSDLLKGEYSLFILNVETGEFQPIFNGRESRSPQWSPVMMMASTPTPSVTGDCTSGWTRLEVGKKARVMGEKNDTPNRVRSEPKKGDNQMGNVYPGDIVDVLEGPICADGLIFWKISGKSITGAGWTAEGDGTEYWLEPYKK